MTRRFLPAETIDMIIDFLHDDVLALKQCRLVCWLWYPSSRYHLFGSLQFDLYEPVDPSETNAITCIIHENSVRLASYAHTIQGGIDFGENSSDTEEEALELSNCPLFPNLKQLAIRTSGSSLEELPISTRNWVHQISSGITFLNINSMDFDDGDNIIGLLSSSVQLEALALDVCDTQQTPDEVTHVIYARHIPLMFFNDRLSLSLLAPSQDCLEYVPDFLFLVGSNFIAQNFRLSIADTNV